MHSDQFSISKGIPLFAFLIVLLLLASVASLLFGSVAISPRQLLITADRSQLAQNPEFHILLLRIPRTLGGIGAGLALSSSGLLLQTIMNNSLASPNTIGVNAGAGFAMILSMILLPGAILHRGLFAFLGALACSLLIFLLAYLFDASRITIILAGISISTFLSSAMNLLKLLDTDLLINMNRFLIGSLSGLQISQLLLPLPLILLSLLLACLLSPSLNIISLGDEIALSLGIPLLPLRLLLLSLASLLAASAVSYTGLLSFVGLIVPHMARKLFGSDMRILLPACALVGAIYVLLCDLVGRLLIAPLELPVGIIMSFLGAPFFLYLLLYKKGGRRLG